MWAKEFRNIPTDSTLKKTRVESGKGITGCEMHEIAGWGDSYHKKRKIYSGAAAAFLSFFSWGKE